MRIANERNELRKQVASLTREVEDIKQQNRELENKTAQNWFLIGAGVVVGGILLGRSTRTCACDVASSWGSLPRSGHLPGEAGRPADMSVLAVSPVVPTGMPAATYPPPAALFRCRYRRRPGRSDDVPATRSYRPSAYRE